MTRYDTGRNLLVIEVCLRDNGSNVDLENRQSNTSCPMEAHKRSDIYGAPGKSWVDFAPRAAMITSSALNIT